MVERCIGAFQQFNGVVAVVGENRNADSSGDGEAVATDREGVVQNGGAHLLGSTNDAFDTPFAEIFQEHDGELIATDARRDIGLA